MSLGPCHWHLHCPFPKPWAIWTLFRSLGRKALGGGGRRPDTWKLGSETTGRKKVPTACSVYLVSGWTRGKWLGFGRQVPAKVTLETLGNSLWRKELYVRATQAAHHRGREPGGRRGLVWPWLSGRRGRLRRVCSPLGWAGWNAARRRRRGAGPAGWKAGLSFVRGFARRGAPLPRPLGAVPSPRALGRGGRGLGEASSRAPGLPGPAPRRAEAPPSRLGLQSSPPLRRLGLGSAESPAAGPGLRLHPPPLALRVLRPGFQEGVSRRGGAARRGAGGGEPPASPALPAGERTARREAGGRSPPGPSGAFCSQPEVCLPGP